MFKALKYLFWFLYNKIFPLPGDEALSEKLRQVLAEIEREEGVPSKAKPTSCCIVTLDVGGTYCFPDIHDTPHCVVMGHVFDPQPHSAHIFPGGCPNGSRVIRR